MISNITKNSYFAYTRDLLSSILFIFPLLILYELLSFLIFYDKNYEIRNSADIFLRSYFYNIGTASQFQYIIFLLILVLLYIYINKNKYNDYKFNSLYKQHFSSCFPCRTTIEVLSLPTPIAIELKVIATI